MAQNLTTTGASDPINVHGGSYFFHIQGTWGGTTATLEWAEEKAGTYIPLKDLSGVDAAFSADHNASVSVSPGFVRISLSGGTGISLNFGFSEV